MSVLRTPELIRALIKSNTQQFLPIQLTLQTTDDTPTNTDSIEIPDDCGGIATMWVIGLKDDATAVNTYVMYQGFRKTAGSLFLIDTTNLLGVDPQMLGAYPIFETDIDGNLVVQIVGTTTDVINWLIEIKILTLTAEGVGT
jgi:hypothetical protein